MLAGHPSWRIDGFEMNVLRLNRPLTLLHQRQTQLMLGVQAPALDLFFM
jgi:hypothetical protein